MLIVRNVFNAKPGQAGKLAAMFKQVRPHLTNARILTDYTGGFNRVILEHEEKDLASVEARLKEYAANPDWKTAMKGYTDLWTEGSREILQVVE